MFRNPRRAPIENKTAVGLTWSTVALAITWVATNFAFKHWPRAASTGATGGFATAAYFAGSYLAKHSPRLEEVLDMVYDHFGLNGHEIGVAGINAPAEDWAFESGAEGDAGTWNASASATVSDGPEPAVDEPAPAGLTDSQDPFATFDSAAEAPPAPEPGQTQVISPLDLGVQADPYSGSSHDSP